MPLTKSTATISAEFPNSTINKKIDDPVIVHGWGLTKRDQRKHQTLTGYRALKT